MDNDKVKGIFWKSYNWFWNKWKDEILPRESDKWDAVVKDAKEVMCEYDCRMCKKVILALLTELEERSWEEPGKYEPEVIKLIVQQLTDKGIMLMY